MNHTRKRLKKKNVTNVVLTIIGILVVLLIFLPILWMIRTSVITLVDLYKRPLVLIFEPIIDSYKSVFCGFSTVSCAGSAVGSGVGSGVGVTSS